MSLLLVLLLLLLQLPTATTAILAVVVVYFLLNLHEHFHIPEMIAGRCIEFLENDVDVDDVDDGAKDAGAYFFVRQSDGHTNCELHSLICM